MTTKKKEKTNFMPQLDRLAKLLLKHGLTEIRDAASLFNIDPDIFMQQIRNGKTKDVFPKFITRAMDFHEALTRQKNALAEYLSAFEVINGIAQHPSGLNFNEWQGYEEQVAEPNRIEQGKFNHE